jgi:hypothetical protein
MNNESIRWVYNALAKEWGLVYTEPTGAARVYLAFVSAEIPIKIKYMSSGTQQIYTSAYSLKYSPYICVNQESLDIDVMLELTELIKEMHPEIAHLETS